MAKIDKYDILADVVDALRDENQDILVETLGDRRTGTGVWVMEDGPQIPLRSIDRKWAKENNIEHVRSVKIGKDISMRETGNLSYIVRTPRGEAKFSLRDDHDFTNIWRFVRRAYRDSDRAGDYKIYKKGFVNPKLASIAAAPMAEKDKKSKFNAAKEQLAKMGIEKTDEELKKRLAKIQAKASER